MIPIAEGSFELAAPQMDKWRLRTYAERLFTEADARAALLAFDDYGFQLELEQGSLKGRNLLVVSAFALADVVAHYGSVRQGMREIAADAKGITEFVVERAPELIGSKEAKLKYKRSNAGAVGKLNRLFDEVAAGKLTAAQAEAQALRMLEEYGDVPDRLREQVSSTMHSTRRDPQQLKLIPSIDEDLFPVQEPPERRYPSPPKDVLPNARLKMRVQVRRDHRNGPMRVQVTPVKRKKGGAKR